MSSGIIFSLALYLGLFTLRGQCLRMSGVWVPPVAISGTEVKFTCHYETSPSLNDTLYSLKWYRGHDQFYEYIPRNIPPMKVYESAHVHVDKSQSDANTVVLKGITRETSGSFQCEVMGDKPLFETDNYTKNMTVVDIPAWGPRLTHRPLSSKVGVQDIIQARCEVGPSDPPTEITWTINRAPAPPYARVETYRNENRVHVSELHIQVTEDLFYKGELVVACGAKLLSAFEKTANVTFVDANAPEPAGYGWLSAGEIVQGRWKPLKECFRRELQTQRDKSGDVASTGRMYVYFERLLLLASTLQAPEANVNHSTATYEDDEGDEEKDVGFASLDEPTEPPKENDPPISHKKIYDEVPEVLKNKAHENIDKDMLFFLSLVPEFQTLEPDLQLDVKIELLQVIKRAQQINRQRSLENGSSVSMPNGSSFQQGGPYHQRTAGPHSVHGSFPTSGPQTLQGPQPTHNPLHTQGPQPTKK